MIKHSVSYKTTPFRSTIVMCSCGWQKTVRHRNALARSSKARAADRAHMKAVEVKP
jgi:hypothetical protein